MESKVESKVQQLNRHSEPKIDNMKQMMDIRSQH